MLALLESLHYFLIVASRIVIVLMDVEALLYLLRTPNPLCAFTLRATDERLWFLLHVDIGPTLLCVWYRPGLPEIDSCVRFRELNLRVSVIDPSAFRGLAT